MPWREHAGFRKVIVQRQRGVGLAAFCLVVEQDVPSLSEAVNRMAMRLGPQG